MSTKAELWAVERIAELEAELEAVRADEAKERIALLEQCLRPFAKLGEALGATAGSACRAAAKALSD